LIFRITKQRIRQEVFYRFKKKDIHYYRLSRQRPGLGV